MHHRTPQEQTYLIIESNFATHLQPGSGDWQVRAVTDGLFEQSGFIRAPQLHPHSTSLPIFGLAGSQEKQTTRTTFTNGSSETCGCHWLSPCSMECLALSICSLIFIIHIHIIHTCTFINIFPTVAIICSIPLYMNKVFPGELVTIPTDIRGNVRPLWSKALKEIMAALRLTSPSGCRHWDPPGWGRKWCKAGNRRPHPTGLSCDSAVTWPCQSELHLQTVKEEEMRS